MYKWVTLGLMLMLAACASPQYNYVPSAVDISEPPIGHVHTASVGDVLLRQGMYVEQQAIHLQNEISVGMFGVYTFSPGFYLKVGEDKKSEFFEPETGPYGGRVKRAALADPYQSMQVYKTEQKICGVSVFGGKACSTDGIFTRTMRPSLVANSFQQSLIYSGRVGDKINIGYREFSSSYARPAFNNDVEYDLTTSNTIGYKGAKLEILEATNEHIRYRVLQNFTPR